MWELEETDTTKPSSGAKSHHPESILDRPIALSVWSGYRMPYGNELGWEGRGWAEDREGAGTVTREMPGGGSGQWAGEKRRRQACKMIKRRHFSIPYRQIPNPHNWWGASHGVCPSGLYTWTLRAGREGSAQGNIFPRTQGVGGWEKNVRKAPPPGVQTPWKHHYTLGSQWHCLRGPSSTPLGETDAQSQGCTC